MNGLLRQLEPHELLFVVLGLGCALALFAAGASTAGVVAGAVSLAALALFLHLQRDGQARYVFAYVVTWALYAGSTRFVELTGCAIYNESLACADVWLLGQEASVFFGPLSVAQIELLSTGYLTYHVYLHWSLIDAAFRGAAWRSQFAKCLYLAFGFGFLGYYMLPAAPPAPLASSAGAIAALNGWINDRLAAGYDAFPSVHVLIAGVILVWDFHHFRRRFKLMLVPCLVMLVSTMALRFHYAVDVLVSLVLVAALAPLARVPARTTA